MSRVSASARLRRILALVPWLASRPDGAPIDEICQRFGVERDQLLADLDVLWMVGVHPFSPDELIDVIIDDDRVSIRLADWFRQPLRLTPDQALALVATGQSLAAVPGSDPDGPLARGIAKVAAVLGVEADALEVELGEAEDELVQTLQRAVDARRRVHLDYYSYGRDELTGRDVDPLRVFAEGGQWYLHGYCHLSEDERVFRIDRIRDLEVLDVSTDGTARPEVSGVFQPSAETPRVVLDLAPPARWVVEQYPTEVVEELEGGALRATLAVSSLAWFERLLLRLGPDVTVVEGPDELLRAGRHAARRVLARYRSR